VELGDIKHLIGEHLVPKNPQVKPNSVDISIAITGSDAHEKPEPNCSSNHGMNFRSRMFSRAGIMGNWQKMTMMNWMIQTTNLNSECAPPAATMTKKNCGTVCLLMTRMNDKKKEITRSNPLSTLSNVG
jgi:hypothetical protein